MVQELPPQGSRLDASLERGYFQNSFRHVQPVGSGGFGTVMKAWHIEDEQWYAVKFIPLELRAWETVDNDSQGWCGAELFEKLVGMRSPSVLRYFRRWTELEEDIFHISSSAEVEAEFLRVLTQEDLSEFELSGLDEGPGEGFEWLAETQDSSNDIVSPVGRTHRSRRFKVVLAIQMEFFEGVTLDQWIAEPRIRLGLTTDGLEGAIGLFKQLMTGLSELHQNSIVHRDVKPNNVMISKANGQLKIIDFGLARQVDHDKYSKQASTSRLPPEGECEALVEIGTAGYAPPEQCTIKPRSNFSPPSSPVICPTSSAPLPESDVFSAGIVLVELLMAYVKDGPAWGTAMERATAFHALRAGHGEPAALPFEIRRALVWSEGWLRQMMARMLAWDAHVRPSAVEVLSELHAKFFSKGRRNPYIGSLIGSSPQLSALADPPSRVQNPYIGFFLDHAPRPFEQVVVG
jgi:serine/threonine protein kinase